MMRVRARLLVPAIAVLLVCGTVQSVFAAGEPAAAVITELRQLRERRVELKTVLMGMLARRVAVDMIQVLDKKGFSEADTQRVLQSREFGTYQERIVKHPKIQKALDRVLDQALSEENFVKVAQKLQRDEADAQATELVLFFQKLVRDQKNSGMNLKPREDFLGLRALWRELSDKLFG